MDRAHDPLLGVDSVMMVENAMVENAIHRGVLLAIAINMSNFLHTIQMVTELNEISSNRRSNHPIDWYHPNVTKYVVLYKHI